MSVNSGAAGMLTPVHIYLIWYGAWTSSVVDETVQRLVPILIKGLNDSAISSIWQTYNSNYGHPDGDIQLVSSFSDTPGLHGNFLGDAQSQSEISELIYAGVFPNDINGVYVILPHSGVTVEDENGTAYCNGMCGYNYSAIINGTNKLKYIVVPENTGSCTACQWGFTTPNTASCSDLSGQIDLQLTALEHELSEIITDPDESNGWYNSSTAPVTQMADFCVTSSREQMAGGWYSLAASDCPYFVAQGNAFLNGTDFLLQMLRVNQNNGQYGYCTNSYGGPFSNQNFGFSWSPTFPQDWAPGNYKGECQPGQPLIGLSAVTTSPGQAHSVFCDTGVDWSHGGETLDYPSPFGQSDLCHLVPFDGLDGFENNYNVNGNWDPGYYVDQCNQSEFAAGASQSTAGRVNGLLCCPGTNGGVTARSCAREIIGQSPIPTADWDYGSFKAQCQSPGQYVAGVSANTTTGSPHAILCCDP